MSKPTYKQVAESFSLWGEYVDPAATMTEEEFDAMTTEEKVQIQVEIWGEEEGQEEDDDDFALSPDDIIAAIDELAGL